MITQSDLITSGYLFLLVGAIIVTVGSLVVYVDKTTKLKKKK